MKRTLLSLITCALMTCNMAAQDYAFRLKNALGVSRNNETVEVIVPQGTNLNNKQLTDVDGNTIAFEIANDTTLRFQANIGKANTKQYTLSSGVPTSPQKLTYAAIKEPSSRSDIAWENDRVAYRMYSSVLLKNEPNTGNGIDLWQKKKRTPVIDDMYKLSNYHNESEYGVDAFSVNGKRLGVGGVSHVVNGKLIIHDPHNSCEIIENSALQTEFVITYDKITVDGVQYKKTVRIINSAGALLNKAIVRYEPLAGQTGKTIKLAVALYQHTDMSGVTPAGVSYKQLEGLAGWAENPSEGSVTSTGARFYQGCYVPGGGTTTEVIDDHLCVTTNYEPGTDLLYYFGGGWSVWPADTYTCDEDWFSALNNFKQQVDHPITKTSWEGEIPQRNDVLAVLNKANSYWQGANPSHGDHFWNRAVYHTGNMAAYEVTQDQSYLDYSVAWAQRNNYWGQTGTDKLRWKYTYGESADYVLFGDNQICFQVYADLYNILGGEEKIARAREVMEYQMSTQFKGYWWWVDGFYMVMPVMTKLYNITHNEQYLEKLHEYWVWGTERMWDEEEGLYYRDTTYVYPKHTTNTGGKDFWARGDGWITAALPRVLSELPKDNKYRDEYIIYYKRLAEALRKCQRTDADGNGYWCRSLLEESYAPGYETSGTALNTYGLLWGINNGILDEEVYGATVQKAWKYLTKVALQPNGLVGYVQPIGSNAAPGTYMTASQTADFGVGAFLLAAAEMSRYASGEAGITPLRITNVSIGEANEITIKFNNTPSEEGLTTITNYLIDGEALTAGSVTYDGDRSVMLTLPKALDYGRYTVAAQNITTKDGGEIEPTQTRMFVRYVPLGANTTIKGVSAIGAQSGNPASNVIDNKMDTRWSQEGTGQWIQFNLGSKKDVYAVDIAWYLGNTRVNYFDIQCSQDGKSWTTILSDQASSGMTNEMERYRFAESVNAQYVRIVCNGASSTTWNSLTEARVRVADSTIDDIVLPEIIYTDILLPTETKGGTTLTWMSDNTNALSGKGIATPTSEEQAVTLTALAGDREITYSMVVVRNIEQTLQLRYDFEENQVYTEGTTRYIKDMSAHGRDGKLMNNSVVDGTLNLNGNTESGFVSNGYVLVPSHLLDSLRSYTVLLEATPSVLAHQPRLYDFGNATSNSVFLRASGLAAGLKYNGGTTVLTNGGELKTGIKQQIAVTFDARTLTTTVFVDGKQVAQTQDIKYEPYELTKIATDTRNYIGRTQWWNSSSKADNVDFKGNIDNFRLYSVALTADEIADLFEEIATGIVAPHTSQEQHTHTYDLSGRRVGAQPLKPGLYITNGVKTVVK